MKMLRRILIVLLGIALLGWIPSLVEWFYLLRKLPKNLAWEIRFNGTSNEQDLPSRVVLDSDANLLLTGMSFPAKGSWLVKHDVKTGQELWRWSADFILQSAPTADGGSLYLAGSAGRGYRPGPIAPPFGGPDTDFAVCKVSGKDGLVAWNTTFDGGLRDTDWAEKIVLSSDGNPVAAGFTPDDTRYFGCAAKLDAHDGHTLWQHQTRDDSVVFWHGSLALVSDQAGDVVLASSRKSDDPGASKATFWLSKLRGRDGATVWTVEFPAASPQRHFLSHLAVTPEGDYIATGYHAKDRGRNLVVAKFAGNDGRLLWNIERDADSHETIEPTSLAVAAIGNAFIAARSWNGSLTSPLYDSWTLKLSDVDGAVIWTKRDTGKQTPFAAGAICSTRKLMLGSGDKVVSAGSVWNGRNVDAQAQWLSDSDGLVLRTVIYDGAAHDHDLFRDAALLPSDEVVVALSSSRCPVWIKPLKALIYRLGGGVDWRSIHSETNEVDDEDPFNYDSVIWQSLPGHQ